MSELFNVVSSFTCASCVHVFDCYVLVLVGALQEKHIQEVLEASQSFSRRTEQKLITKMEVTLKNRESQLLSLMERLQDHVSLNSHKCHVLH